MSHIPSSAMPHAGGTSEAEPAEESRSSVSTRAGKLKDKARENPKTAMAAGAALVAGAVAAAAIPLVRARKQSGEKKDSKGGAKKSSTKQD